LPQIISKKDTEDLGQDSKNKKRVGHRPQERWSAHSHNLTQEYKTLEKKETPPTIGIEGETADAIIKNTGDNRGERYARRGRGASKSKARAPRLNTV